MLHLDDWDDTATMEPPAPEPADDALQIIDVDQNSDEWLRNRMGISTASAFDKVITRGRADQPSATRHKYLLQLLGERLTGQPAENFSTADTERGHEYEPMAAAEYEFQRGVAIESVGFMRRGDMGCSPDRVIVGERGLVEIKSKKPTRQLAVLLADAMPDEHKPQVQGGLLVSGYEFCDFVSYWPGLPLFVKRIYRNEEYIDWLCGELDRFNDELDEMERYFITTYYGGVHPQRSGKNHACERNEVIRCHH